MNTARWKHVAISGTLPFVKQAKLLLLPEIFAFNASHAIATLVIKEISRDFQLTEYPQATHLACCEIQASQGLEFCFSNS